MKFFVLILVSVFIYLMMCSYKNGPASTHGWDCTGAETGLGNVTGCRGTSCHGTVATSSIDVAIELDSAGYPTTNYVGGVVYTVKITGTNNSTFTLPKYGFQIGCIQGSTSAVTPVNKGTWSGTLPASTHIANPQAGNFVVRVVEHSIAIPATTGTGSTGTIYTKTFNWTAPPVGTGTISFWAALNAVNADTVQSSADKWNTTHLVINELILTTGITDPEFNNAISLSVYPNPTTDFIHVNYRVAEQGKVEINLLDLQSRLVAPLISEIQSVGDYKNALKIPFNLNSGIYFLEIATETNKQLTKILVQR